MGIVFETSTPKIILWQFLFWKNLSALETITSDNNLLFFKGKNNSFTTNDWQEKHIFVYLVNFASFYWEQILSMAPFKISCLGQNLYNLNKPSAFAKHWWWQKISLTAFFASADGP